MKNIKRLTLVVMLGVVVAPLLALALASRAMPAMVREYDYRAISSISWTMAERLFPVNVVRVTQRRPRPGCAETARCGITVLDVTNHNMRVNAGINWQADIMSSTGTPTVNAQCNYIALTNTAITPGGTDTTLSGEISANGLSRAQGTYTHSANATSYTISKVFTCATGAQAAQGAGMFTAASTGTMCFENTFTQASLQIGDTLTVTWTINF